VRGQTRLATSARNSSSLLQKRQSDKVSSICDLDLSRPRYSSRHPIPGRDHQRRDRLL
jgi:hypothetical protein